MWTEPRADVPKKTGCALHNLSHTQTFTQKWLKKYSFFFLLKITSSSTSICFIFNGKDQNRKTVLQSLFVGIFLGHCIRGAFRTNPHNE